ncbi:serine arginine-rich splicing factor [Chytridiales sp. JEL 0842]|nr:serine arginine-rich splicing factor [Chytridiales sp. JEL 0842]
MATQQQQYGFGKLPRDATERDVKKLFREFGPIRDVRLLIGFGFVEFDDSRDARDAVDKLDGTRFLGERIQVEPAKGGDRRDRDRGGRDRDSRSSRSGKYRITVDNLPGRTSWQSLKDLMRNAGDVTFADVDRDGLGIVEFSNSDDLQKALKMYDDYEYEGRRLYVKESRSSDRDRRGRDRSRSRSRSRGRNDRSRSRSRNRDRKRSRSRSRSGRDRSGSRDRKDKDSSRDRSRDRKDRDTSRDRSRDRKDRDSSRDRSPKKDRENGRSRDASKERSVSPKPSASP